MTQENNKEMPRLIRLREVNSTNAYIQSLSRDERLPEGSVVWADFQTAGRGQIGNVWESENGKNLTFSIVFYPSFLLAKHQFLISQIASLSVKETLDEFISGITVKWPNDVYWNDKKICGMLIENDLAGQYIYSSVIGIGININQAVFRGDAAAKQLSRQIQHPGKGLQLQRPGDPLRHQLQGNDLPGEHLRQHHHHAHQPVAFLQNQNQRVHQIQYRR